MPLPPAPGRPALDSDEEYRAIEATLSQTAPGRWFLAEHRRRARRLDSAALQDAIGRLQSSLRAPPALLDQLKRQIEELSALVAETRSQLVTTRPVAPLQPGGAGTAPAQGILRAVEDIHELAWSLQAEAMNPARCEAIARQASIIYALSHTQAVESERMLRLAGALDKASARLGALLDTVLLELRSDDGTPDEPR